MKQVMDYIEMKIPAKPDYLSVIRLTLSGIASRMGYTFEVIEDLKIAVSEACTNAIQHAYSEDEVGEVIIGFGIYEDKLELMVADSGKSFDFIQTKNELGPYTEASTVEQLSEGGLGLFLIETLTNPFSFSDAMCVRIWRSLMPKNSAKCLLDAKQPRSLSRE